MVYFVGTDEAGYGPNLGPLVVTATVWQAPDGVTVGGLYDLVADTICRRPAASGDQRLAIADSKQLYQPGGGLRHLERGVAAATAVCGTRATTWRRAWQELAGRDSRSLDILPWHHGYDHPLPLECEPDDIPSAAAVLRGGLAGKGVQLMAIRAVAIFPDEFNRLLDRHGNKASLLSHCTLELVRRLLAELPAGPACVACDKHGGRNQYGPILQTLFPDFLVEVRRESRELSVYAWGTHDRRVEFQFAAQGERLLPTALASMVSKYLRELAMQAFNAFWVREVAGLRPTAGYPVDARRFKQEIAARQQTLGIPDSLLWRCR